MILQTHINQKKTGVATRVSEETSGKKYQERERRTVHNDTEPIQPEDTAVLKHSLNHGKQKLIELKRQTKPSPERKVLTYLSPLLKLVTI